MAEQRILCNLPNREGNPDKECKGVLAHVISPRMLKIGRGDQRISFVITDGNAQCVLTCPVCRRIHTLIWRAKELVTGNLKLEEVVPKPDGDPNDPNNPNNPGQEPGGVEPPADPPKEE